MYAITFWLTDSYNKKVVCLQKKEIGWIFRIEGHTSCRNSFKACKILTVASIYILEELCFYKRVSHEY
jgi:hypothetical protein